MSGINEENDTIPLFLCELSSLEYRLAYSSLYILVFNFGLPTVKSTNNDVNSRNVHLVHFRYLCLLVYSGVQHIFSCVFFLFFFLRLYMYPMLPVSLDFPFFDCTFGILEHMLSMHLRCSKIKLHSKYCVTG